MKHELTIRQRQRIGAKLAKYNREIDNVLNKASDGFKSLLTEMIERCYREGFNDGIETERDEQDRQKRKPRY